MEEYIEIWNDIPNYGNYEVSSLGRVRNKKTGRVLKAADTGGYYSVGLSCCIRKNYFVHQLVAQAFLPNPENKPQVNHLDKNGLNNKVSNLQWVTNKENSIHRSNGVKQTTNQNLTIWRIDMNSGEKLEKYNSIGEASKWIIEQGLASNLESVRGSISCSVRGVYKSSFGFKWAKIEHTDLENEIWKEIIIENEDTSGYYISSLGRFKNKKGVIMSNYKPHHSGYIYLRVNIKKYALHRLVALMFLPNSENKPFVNHIDGNKINNKLENLEWVTCSENNFHAHKAGLTKVYTRKIVQYDLEMNKLNEFNSIVEASNQLNIGKTNINGVLYNNRKSAGGFVFKYADDTNIDFSKKITINKNRGRPVGQYDISGNLLHVHNSIAEASRKLNIHKNNIWGVITHFRKTSGGFIWKYLEENKE